MCVYGVCMVCEGVWVCVRGCVYGGVCMVCLCVCERERGRGRERERERERGGNVIGYL